jgi:hypothetical protein
MSHAKIEPPASLSRAERRVFRRMVSSLRLVGIDVAARRELLTDFCRLEARLEQLQAQETTAKGKARLAAARAVSVATAERRRLHEALFKGARKLLPRPSRAEVVINSDRFSVLDPTDADRGWWRGLASGTPREELERQYGPPSWLVLTEDSEAAALEAARIVRQSYRRGSLVPGEDDEQR